MHVDSTRTAGTASGKNNVIAGTMTVTGDMRTLSPEQLAKTEQAMREIVSHHLPKTGGEITFDDGYPPMAPTDGNRRALAMYDQASRDLGFGAVTAVDPSKAGAADAAFIANIVPMVIDGIGLSGHDDHSDKETADLRRLPSQTKRAAVLMLRLSQLEERHAVVARLLLTPDLQHPASAVRRLIHIRINLIPDPVRREQQREQRAGQPQQSAPSLPARRER